MCFIFFLFKIKYFFRKCVCVCYWWIFIGYFLIVFYICFWVLNCSWFYLFLVEIFSCIIIIRVCVWGNNIKRRGFFLKGFVILLKIFLIWILYDKILKICLLFSIWFFFYKYSIYLIVNKKKKINRKFCFFIKFIDNI